MGRPTRMTNARDLQNEALLPRRKVLIDCPPGYSHGSPPIENPYTTPSRSKDNE
jgi:hypothetical protein